MRLVTTPSTLILLLALTAAPAAAAPSGITAEFRQARRNLRFNLGGFTRSGRRAASRALPDARAIDPPRYYSSRSAKFSDTRGATLTLARDHTVRMPGQITFQNNEAGVRRSTRRGQWHRVFRLDAHQLISGSIKPDGKRASLRVETDVRSSSDRAARRGQDVIVERYDLHHRDGALVVSYRRERHRRAGRKGTVTRTVEKTGRYLADGAVNLAQEWKTINDSQSLINQVRRKADSPVAPASVGGGLRLRAFDPLAR